MDTLHCDRDSARLTLDHWVTDDAAFIKEQSRFAPRAAVRLSAAVDA